MPDCVYSILGQGPYDGYYCTKHYVGDGSTTEFQFPFPYLGQDDWAGETSPYIRIWLNGVETFQWTMGTSASIEFVTAPAVNICIKIRRDSNLAERKVNFQSGSRHTAGVENLDSKNAFYLIQELADQLYDATLDLTPSENNFNAYNWTADGTTTQFPMSETYGPVDQSGLSNDAEVLVFLNGAVQQIDAYALVDIGGITNVVITPAPPNGFAVEARTMTSGTPQTVQIPNESITGDMLADCCIDTDNWNRIACLDDLGEPGEVFVWEEGTGGPELAVRPLTPEEISGFDTAVRSSRLDQMGTPSSSVSMNNQKIVNLATGTNANDAVNKAQMDAAILLAVPSGTVPQIVTGSVTFNSTSFATEELGFSFDALLLNLSYIVSYTAPNGTAGHTYTNTQTYTQVLSDGTGEIQYVFAPSTFGGGAQYAFNIQKTATGFKYRRSGYAGDTLTIRYTAIKHT